MTAECARPTCEKTAEVLLAFDPRTARAWMRDLNDSDPSMGLLLCTKHAEGTSVPISWEIIDERRSIPTFTPAAHDAAPSFDEIFPPRAGYGAWDRIPQNEQRELGTFERLTHDAEPAPPRESPRFTPRNLDDEPVFADAGGPALDPLHAPPRAGRSSSQDKTATEGDGASRQWWETDGGVQPKWLSDDRDRLDFGGPGYYDPYLDDPDLTDDPPPARVENPVEPAVAKTSGPLVDDAVAPLVRPGSPNEQIPAADLLAAAEVQLPLPIPPRRPAPTVRDPQSYQQPVNLPERADGSSAADDTADDTDIDLAASGTEGIPLPPAPPRANGE